ncbi:MAG: hydroxymethylglutaryl-CoA lyase [Thermoanaerobaculia bacterium]
MTPSDNLPERVRLIEVGPRDGFQMEDRFVPTDLKVATVEGLASAGLGEIEVTAFAHPRVIPQMADAAEVLAAVKDRWNVRLSALVPNLEGAQRALEVGGIDEIRVVVCATESYNQTNVGLSISESAERFARIAESAQERGIDASVVFGVALGCPIEGDVPIERVIELTERFIGLGAAAIGVADSYGLANPRQVRSSVREVQEVLAGRRLWLHLHNTRGMALANALAALEEGVDSFDTAFGGLGGTPIMKGASGNIATEDFVYMCSEMGIETGVDLDRVREASERIAGFLGRSLPSHVLRAGTKSELMALNRS